MKNKIKVSVVFTDNKTENPLKKQEIYNLLSSVCMGEKVTRGSVGVVFVDAEHIQELNTRYLKHDYPTDVLAFSLQKPGKSLEGEIYICSELAQTQACDYNVPFKEELMRLVVHGMLHLIGYDDRDDNERERMMAKGEYYLEQFLNRVYRN